MGILLRNSESHLQNEVSYKKNVYMLFCKNNFMRTQQFSLKSRIKLKNNLKCKAENLEKSKTSENKTLLTFIKLSVQELWLRHLNL